MPRPATLALAGALVFAAPAFAQNQPTDPPMNLPMNLPANPAAEASGRAMRDGAPASAGGTGMGTLGRGVEAGNLQCPPRGETNREVGGPGSRLGVACAPTGAPPVLPSFGTTSPQPAAPQRSNR